MIESKFKIGDKVVFKEKFGGIIIAENTYGKEPVYRVVCSTESLLYRSTDFPNGDGEFDNPLNMEVKSMEQLEIGITSFFFDESELRMMTEED